MFLTLLIGGRDDGRNDDLALVEIPPATADAQQTSFIALTPETTLAPDPEPQVIAVAVPDPAPAPLPEPVADAAVFAAVAAAIANTTEPQPAPEPETAPVWYVNAKQLNVREGPSTDFAVVEKLVAGEAALIVSDPTAEWVKIRIEGDGVEGYVAARFLTATNPLSN
jgi:uncharacterized protein YgiM (DUF1202 family)